MLNESRSGAESVQLMSVGIKPPTCSNGSTFYWIWTSGSTHRSPERSSQLPPQSDRENVVVTGPVVPQFYTQSCSRTPRQAAQPRKRTSNPLCLFVLLRYV